jgi:CRP/FNR family transcriptional regulator, cyclic AMP receptor protein
MNLSEGRNDESLSNEFQENLNSLRETYFFSSFPLEALKVFTYLCKRELFKAGDPLFIQGEDDGQAFLIISGSAQLLREQAGEHHVVREYASGTFLGGAGTGGQFTTAFLP